MRPNGRRRWWVVVLAAVTVGAVIVGGLVWYVRREPAEPPTSETKALSFSLDPRYEFAPSRLGLPVDASFEIPANFDLDVVSRPGKEAGKPYASEVVEVFADAAFTRPVGIRVGQETAGSVVTVQAWGSVQAAGDGGTLTFTDVGEWGPYGEFFLVEWLTADGEERERPLVTRFTIEHPLDSPVSAMSIVEEFGDVALQWSEVDDADEYAVLTSCGVSGSRSRYFTVLARTTETEWSSAENVEYWQDEPWPITQNRSLNQFSVETEDIWISDGPYVSGFTGCDLGVLALADGGAMMSAYRAFDASGEVAGLPYEVADQAAEILRNYTLPQTMDEVPAQFVFTSLDGMTRSTYAQIDLNSIEESVWQSPNPATKKWDDVIYWKFSFVGAGTRLGMWQYVRKDNVPDIRAAAAEFNERVRATVPPTGQLRLPTSLARMNVADDRSSETPTPNLPVYGSNPLTELIARHLAVGTQVIDVSRYRGVADAPDPYDAALEAISQNPYVFGVKGLSVSGDGAFIYVEYAPDNRRSSQTAAKVVEVVESVVTDGMTDAQKVTALNDWLVANAEFDSEAYVASAHTASVDGEFAVVWRADSVLLDGRGVAASYASAFALLAREAGLEAVVVNGTAEDGGSHTWNKVKVDGDWLIVDTAWNDAPEANQFLMVRAGSLPDGSARLQGTDWMVDSLLSTFATP